MKENYFLINGIMYIVKYVDFKVDVYKLINNQRVELDDAEKESIQKVIKRNSSYIYNSIGLDEIISENESLSTNEILPNLLEWLESIISQGHRDTFYNNVRTLKIEEVEKLDSNIKGEYNVKENKIRILRPDKYSSEREYARRLLEELIHMASSKYDLDNNIIISGLDQVVVDFDKRNRGLTEGIASALSSTGVNGLGEQLNENQIETLIAQQLSKIISPGTILYSFFDNKGITDLTKELINIGYDESKAYELFRNIEINYMFSGESEKENVLGNIQSSLIDYFEAKIRKELKTSDIDSERLEEIFADCEKSLITPKKLESMGYNPEKYDGIKESIDKYIEMKSSVYNYANMVDNNKEVEEPSQARIAGFSSSILLAIITGIASLGIIILGLYLGI